ncbi:hypothetical protein AAES_41104 [Amazona aestiva]|uniref:C2H2-type domain-containing protein n=1 Tax=Amazona aestiva TaxID=12930 RepID=A0A0Q3MSA7_AMAAE|nr:hypothetical protein AAES_41104 [Amazona aestiva]
MGLRRAISCKRRTRASDEDVAQIGPKRIRKAAKREILLCDFEGCGKIFSNRQYLNKASLNWHMRKHGAAAAYRFSCELCGKRFEKRDNVAAHKSKSHPPPAPAPPAGPGGGGEMEGIGMRDAGASPGGGMEAVGS